MNSMEWKNVNEIAPDPSKEKRIMVISKNTGKIHIVHDDYDDWLLDEIDEGSPGECIEFELWCNLPNKPGS